MCQRLQAIVVVAIGFLVLPGAALAQSAIAGQVTDASGAVLPGVTVEASSPALIEGVRVVVTDGQGRYSVEALLPGVYRMTFNLAGFATLVREGIVLTTNFTAPVNAELRVGTLAESITVSGESPVVDVQRTTQSTVLTREVLDAVPRGRGWAQAGILIPGMTVTLPDVGGTQLMQRTDLTIHGSRIGDQTPQMDGMNTSCLVAEGHTTCVYADDGAFSEISFLTSNGSAETKTGGITMNLISKDGGNRYGGTGIAIYSDDNFYTQNYNADLAARGLAVPGGLKRMWDYNFSLGGPVAQDKLWFFGSTRLWGVNLTIPDSFDEEGNQGVDDNLLEAYTMRLTYRINDRNKLGLTYFNQPRWRGHRGLAANIDPKATWIMKTFQSYVAQAKWTSTVSNRMLFETGYSLRYYNYGLPYQENVLPTDIAKVDTVLGTAWNAMTTEAFLYMNAGDLMGSMSYVTGTHTFKVGGTLGTGHSDRLDRANGDLTQRYRNSVPFEVQVRNTPVFAQSTLDAEVGLYVQDSWRFKRVTVNPGLRFDYFRSQLPPQTSPAGRFVPERTFAGLQNTPRWLDWSPRFGLVYDLFGNAKTAAKFSAGRYNVQQALSFAGRYNPLRNSNELRTWNDLNRDDIAQDNEIGPPRDVNFGLPVSAVALDPDLRREYNTMYSAEVQHQLVPRLAVTAGVFRRQYFNPSWRDNLLVTPADYSPLTIPDPRGNGRTISIYNLHPAKNGQVRNYDTYSQENTSFFNGYDITLNGRLPKGGTLLAGMSSGLLSTNTCQVDDPNALRFCDRSEFDVPFQTQWKFAGSYPLPFWDISLSAVLQSIPGSERNITYQVTRVVAPTLTLSSLTIPLNEPGSAYTERLNQLDVRFGKTFRLGAKRLQTQFDLFNALNSAAVQSQNDVFGPRLDQVTSVISGRIIRFGAQFDF